MQPSKSVINNLKQDFRDGGNGVSVLRDTVFHRKVEGTQLPTNRRRNKVSYLDGVILFSHGQQ